MRNDVSYSRHVVTTITMTTWNCRSGSMAERLRALEPISPDVLFLQECRPDSATDGFTTSAVNAHKGIALGSPSGRFTVTPVPIRKAAGAAVLAATFAGPVTMTVIGVWAQGRGYVADVLRTVDAYRDVLRSGNAVVLGDFNSGTRLRATPTQNNGHARLLDAFTDVGLVSAYHVFHGVEHGRERHATYRHRFNDEDRWHIDFCFVPSAWADRIASVDVLDGLAWRDTSDHHPVVVTVTI
jgi:endonuclease/exonuclease/phosphatase family metal-dependent hydrolase